MRFAHIKKIPKHYDVKDRKIDPELAAVLVIGLSSPVDACLNCSKSSGGDTHNNCPAPDTRIERAKAAETEFVKPYMDWDGQSHTACGTG